MARKSDKIVRSNRNCCVVNCTNTESKNPELQFYCFPGRSYEVQRKELWIKAVNRNDGRGNLWRPQKNSRVCSVHFVGGKKSDIEHNASYVPSIFPDIYYTAPQNPGLSTGRKCILEQRTKMDSAVLIGNVCKTESVPFETITMTSVPFVEGVFQTEFEESQMQVKTSIVRCQTEPWFDQPLNMPTVLFCSNDENESSTQTEIYVRNPEPTQRAVIEFPTKPKLIDKGCGPDEEMHCRFMGFSETITDITMRQLAGVSRKFFFVLLSFIDSGQNAQTSFVKKLGKENRLLLFLMKMKLDISFCVLGCLFHVDSSTAADIFFQVLRTLTEKTKTWVSWPSRESIQGKIPKSFDNYPNYKHIIYCIEISTDAPPTVEQRILLYSNYKGDFKTKFLIAITPDGFIYKVSKPYGGRATNNFIINDCRVLNLMERGYLVLEDIRYPQNDDNTYKITSARINAERAVERVKILRILDHFPMELISYTDLIMHMCCVIANSRPPLTQQD